MPLNYANSKTCRIMW